MKIVYALGMVILLTGCGTLSGQQKQQLSLVITKCPVLMKYSKSQLVTAAMELKSLSTESQIAKMLTDYSKLRDACRTIEKKIVNKQ